MLYESNKFNHKLPIPKAEVESQDICRGPSVPGDQPLRNQRCGPQMLSVLLSHEVHVGGVSEPRIPDRRMLTDTGPQPFDNYQ